MGDNPPQADETVAPPENDDEKNAATEQEKIDAVKNSKTTPNESDYDSAASDSQTSSRRNSDSEGSVGLERESGDGQESQPSKKVDDDEDKKNPQYIPKRGTFYEHDDRTADDEEAAVKADEPEKDKDGKNKKVWQDKKERWSHDRFNDSDQAPKSRAELVAIYGYDIRNEEGPPRARRRRRYGRGPNKYTRNWEDEDAYNKPAPVRPKKVVPKKSNRPNEEFPPLSNENNVQEQQQAVAEVKQAIINNNNRQTMAAQSEQPPQQEPMYRGQQPRVGSGRVVKPKREVKDADFRGFTSKTRQVRNTRSDEQKIVVKRKDDFIQSQNFTNKNGGGSSSMMHDVEKDMAKLNVQDGIYKGGGKQQQNRQGGMPPRLQQSEQKGSKRYSSIRQRSLPESATPPFNQHSNYYSNDYNQQGQVNQQQQANLIHQSNQIHPSTPQVPQIAPPPLQPIPQVPVTATPILQAAPQFAPPPFAQAPPPFINAAQPFIPQPTPPPLINYVPSQPQFPQGYQGYQQQFNPVTQPTELYQPQTGITYYSTDQQISQRAAAPLKRPKAAIPIVAPPPIDFKGKLLKDDDVSSSYDSDVQSEHYQQHENGDSVVVATQQQH